MDLQVKDVSELLGLSEEEVEQLAKEKKLPAYPMQREYRFSREEIERWMLRHQMGPKAHHFILFRALSNGDVFYGVEAGNKVELIREVAALIAPKLQLDSEVIAELLLDREELMPTALGEGIAVPHARDLLLDKAHDAVFVVFPKEPLDYGALDGKKVHILFFLFASSDKRHLQLLAKIAHLGNSSAMQKLLSMKPLKEGFLEAVKSFESQP